MTRGWLGGVLLVLAAAMPLLAAAERVDPLPPEQAFRFSATMEGDEAVVVYQMPEGIYLYKDKLRITATAADTVMDAPQLPPGSPHDDEFFGRTTVYYERLTVRTRIRSGGEFELVALSQGCDEQVGICYPPLENTALLTAPAVAGTPAVVAATAATDGGGGDDEASALAQGISEHTILWTLGVFFLLGVGLSLTPCVLPMLPILLGIIGGGEKTRRRIAALTASYIGGVVAVFTGLGVLAAKTGQLLTVFLQQPAVLIAVALLFVVLALSMFGAYKLQLPVALRQRLHTVGGGGTTVGAFVLGGVSAVVVSPCVAAPLVGALLYIAAGGDTLTGGLALMSLALGMSVLLAAAGCAGATVLPRAGAWMNHIQRLFGVLLLLLAVWVLSSLLPAPVQMLLYGGLLIFGGLLARPFGAPAADAPLWLYVAKALAVAALLWGSIMLVGAALGGRDVLTPLSPLTAAHGDAREESLLFRSVGSPAELEQAVAAAAAENKLVMLEFYADWCVSCKEMEALTFSDAGVQEKLQRGVLLRADVTDNTADQKALLDAFGLFGPPAILFFDRDGALIENVRVIGYQSAARFSQSLTAAGF